MEGENILSVLRKCKTVAELKKAAEKIGYELDDDEAKYYLEKFNKSGELTDDELGSVSGGCAKWRNGKAYKGTPEHWLIVTVGNSCTLFSRWDGKARVCPNCQSYHRVGAIRYCTKRTYYSDKLNPSK